jgi:hypothetical protein
MNHDSTAGEEFLADGMHVVIRLRRDFTVADAARLLAAARAAYTRVNPAAGPQDAAAAVTTAADAAFTILQSDGLLGHAPDRALAAALKTAYSPAASEPKSPSTRRTGSRPAQTAPTTATCSRCP